MTSKDPTRPNIVMVLTDDHGFWALGCAGNNEVQTPAIDAMAHEGIYFENFFCASPVCSPARASLLTGTIPSYHGVHDWIRHGNMVSGPEVLFPDPAVIRYMDGLTGYTDVLAAHGYNCGLSGKWHLGDSMHPQNGFSHWFVIPMGGSNYQNATVIREGQVMTAPGYLTDVITDDALAFLDSAAGDERPFYLSVHYNAPHAPWERGQHPEALTSLYNGCDFQSCPQEAAHPWLMNGSPIGTGEKRRELLRGYFGSITGVDRSVARLRAKLSQMGMLENTLFIFTGDNGHSNGHHGIWGKGNGTFPQNMYEESVKVPFILSFPGRVPGGKVCRTLLSHYDFLPTLLGWLNLPLPEGAALPGRDFSGLLNGKEIEDNEYVMVCDEYGPVRMVRTREWKYVHRFPYGPHELYNLKEDPGERTNRVNDSACRSMVSDLRALLHDWFFRYADPDRDGASLDVYGMGQLLPVGRRSDGKNAFNADIWYCDENGNRRPGPNLSPI